MRDATWQATLVYRGRHYFNPRIPCGMRPAERYKLVQFYDFNPRIPCGMRLTA